jgi:hypothetical protein
VFVNGWAKSFPRLNILYDIFSLMTTRILRLEGLYFFLLAGYFYFKLGGNWLLFLLLLFTPDLSMIGYLKNPKLGALTYNFIHNFILSITLILLGLVANSQLVILLGLILSAHIGIDRALGYGLKEKTGFNNTHLGKIGR